MKRALLIIFSVLVADQVLKIWVKLNFFYDSAIPILGDKGYLHFIENRGMAFGMEFGGEWGKLLLTLFRIAAVSGIGYSLYHMIKRGATTGLVVSVSLILAGALGNIIDSTFYGLLFSASYAHGLPAEFLPPGGGYSSFLHGKVVDMFYFPLFEVQLPSWIPRFGAESMLFFGPVFNLADVAISWGVAQILFFHRSFFQHPPAAEEDQPQKEEEE